MSGRQTVESFRHTSRVGDIESDDEPDFDADNDSVFLGGAPAEPIFIMALNKIKAIRELSDDERQEFFDNLRGLRYFNNSKEKLFLNLEDYTTILEIVNLFRQGRTVGEVYSMLETMANSGDDFFWASPQMAEMEKAYAAKLAEEFEEIEGAEMPFACSGCANTRFRRNISSTRGDEAAKVWYKCTNCGRIIKS